MSKVHPWYVLALAAGLTVSADAPAQKPHAPPVTVPHGLYIESDFGSRYTSQGGPRSGGTRKVYSSLRGIDFSAAAGTPVIAPTSGEVTMVIGRGRYGGGQVTIENPARTDVGKLMPGATAHFSYYDTIRVKIMYLDAITRTEGEWVEAGDVIGRVALDLDRPRVHLETWTGGTLLNPHLLWLDGTGRVACHDQRRAPYPRDRFVLVAPLPCE